MKTKITTFITATAFLLLFASIAIAQNPKAYFKKNGTTVFQTAIADIDSIVFKQEIIEPACEKDGANCLWVKINGVKWATRNVGASKPEDFGGYYQWNSPTTNFLLYNDYNNSSYPKSTTWLPANDPSPAGFRVPTLAELQSLTNSTYVKYEWTTRNGVYGGRFTDRSNGNCIFLPAAGYRWLNDGVVYYAGSYGYYWSSTQYDSYDLNAYYLYISSSGFAYWNSNLHKSNGFTVRPVAE